MRSVALPQENAGNDPLSQIVHGGGGGWQKPEPEQAPPPQSEHPSSLVGNSNWASRQQEQAASVSQQPLAAESAYLGYGARDRRLNPAEYPSLSAAAYAAQQQQTKQQQQQAVSSSQVCICVNLRSEPCLQGLQQATLKMPSYAGNRSVG